MYSAFTQTPLTRSDMDHRVLPANNAISAFTPQSQSITALWPVLIVPTHERMARLSWPSKIKQLNKAANWCGTAGHSSWTTVMRSVSYHRLHIFLSLIRRFVADDSWLSASIAIRGRLDRLKKNSRNKYALLVSKKSACCAWTFSGRGLLALRGLRGQ